jgi:hypothetical protein
MRRGSPKVFDIPVVRRETLPEEHHHVMTVFGTIEEAKKFCLGCKRTLTVTSFYLRVPANHKNPLERLCCECRDDQTNIRRYGKIVD